MAILSPEKLRKYKLNQNIFGFVLSFFVVLWGITLISPTNDYLDIAEVIGGIVLIVIGIFILQLTYVHRKELLALPLSHWQELRVKYEKDEIDSKLTPQQQEEKRRLDLRAIIKDSESRRKQKERFEVKEMALWMYIGPIIGFIIAVIAGIMIWAAGDNDDVTWLWWIGGIAITPVMLTGFASQLSDQWQLVLEVKEELHADKKNHTLNDFTVSEGDLLFYGLRNLGGYAYKFEHLYTDSKALFLLYSFTKSVNSLSSVVFVILLALLLFMWLGSISIAPTTIIIILLVLILLKK